MNSELLAILRIPESDIVVTRKVPMTNETCDQLRAIKGAREVVMKQELGADIMIPIPTLIRDLINEEHKRIAH